MNQQLFEELRVLQRLQSSGNQEESLVKPNNNRTAGGPVEGGDENTSNRSSNFPDVETSLICANPAESAADQRLVEELQTLQRLQSSGNHEDAAFQKCNNRPYTLHEKDCNASDDASSHSPDIEESLLSSHRPFHDLLSSSIEHANSRRTQSPSNLEQSVGAAAGHQQRQPKSIRFAESPDVIGISSAKPEASDNKVIAKLLLALKTSIADPICQADLTNVNPFAQTPQGLLTQADYRACKKVRRSLSSFPFF